MARKRSPQEKKRLSYERDHRNAYGENDKASRKWIPRRKKLRTRAERKRAAQGLAPGVVPKELADGDHLAAELLPGRDKRRWWQKQPDISLRADVDKKLKRRQSVDVAVERCVFPACGEDATTHGLCVAHASWYEWSVNRRAELGRAPLSPRQWATMKHRKQRTDAGLPPDPA